ncbi:MAG: tyrosine-type recombinase/integrase [Actinobacteria bacterium]|nr:tyrosine-type recombinase/integrase [Actinomycetota bacterium]
MYPEGTLAHFLTAVWLPAIRPTIRESSWTGYEHYVRNQIVPRLGRIKLEDIGAAELDAFYSELLVSGRLGGKGGLSPSTVRGIHATLHRAFRDGVRWGLLYENPADRSHPPHPPTASGSMQVWSSNELASFLRFAQPRPLYPVWHLLAMTGMRKCEVLGLRWEDVNLEISELAVRQTVIWADGKVSFSSPRAAKSCRAIAIDHRTVEVLHDLKTKSGEADGLLFSRNHGEPLDPNLVTRAFRNLVRLSGLPRIRLHDLRHTHAVLALNAGVHPKIVSERLGHANVTTTLRVYSNSIACHQAEATKVLSDLVLEDRS